MKRYEIKYCLALLGAGFFLLACQTTSHIAKVDLAKRKVAIQSQVDSSSAMQYIQKQGVLNETVESLKRKIEKNPRSVNSHLNLAHIYLSQGRLDQAENTVRQALRIDLNNQDARKILAQVHYRRGNEELASIILNSMHADAAKDSQVLNLKGMIAMKRDRHAEALAIFNEALRVNPGDVAVRMNLGVLFMEYQQLDRAAVQFERVLKLMPDHPDAKLHLAVVYSSRKNFAKAEELYDEVLGIQSNNPLAIYNMAVLEERKESFDDAIDYLRSYLDTQYAKRKNNKEVFAMIDRIRVKKEAKGEVISDSDIAELAQKAQESPIVTPEEPNEEVVVDEPIVTSTPTPEKKVEPAKKPAQKPIGDDIESLERALQ